MQSGELLILKLHIRLFYLLFGQKPFRILNTELKLVLIVKNIQINFLILKEIVKIKNLFLRNFPP